MKRKVDPQKIEVTTAVPRQISKKVAEQLLAQKDYLLTEVSIARTRQAISNRSLIDYSTNWAAFNYLYYGSNYAKNYFAARVNNTLHLQGKTTIIDLGCGGGASISGFLSALRDSGQDMSLVEKIICVDKSENQLSLLQSYFKSWVSEEFGNNNVEIINGDIFEFAKNKFSVNVIYIVSYVLSELTHDQGSTLRQSIRLASDINKDKLVIVESSHKKRGLLLEYMNGEKLYIPYDSMNVYAGPIAELGFSVGPKFSDDIVKSIVAAYARAWVSHDFDLIRSIFATDARYQILGVNTLQGIDEILDYWRNNAAVQRNVVFDVISLRTGCDCVTVEWKATFDRIDVGDMRKLTGLMHFSIRNGKIASFVECYRQSRIPRVNEVPSGLISENHQ